MTQAVAFTQTDNGRERTTDGLWTHRGALKLPAGSITTTMLAPGAAQALLGQWGPASPSFSTTITNTWLMTPVSVSVTTTGGLVRVELVTCFSHSVANAQWYVGLGVDSNPLFYTVLTAGAAGAYVPTCLVWYLSPTAATHVFAVAVQMSTPGTLTQQGGTHSAIYVTEQRR